MANALEPGGPRAACQLGVTAESIAQDLLIGPLCAAELINHLGWFAGWDTGEQRALVVRMLHVWGRIAGVPYPG